VFLNLIVNAIEAMPSGGAINIAASAFGVTLEALDAPIPHILAWVTVTAAGPQFGPPGYECDLLYLACLAALVVGGSGPLAIDQLFRKQPRVKELSHEHRG